MVTLKERGNIRVVNLQFIVVTYLSAYNLIMGRPINVTLDAIDFPIHIKLKYHNVHDEPMTIGVGLARA